MADLSIRNLDDAVLRDIDAAAARQGLSRNELPRRELKRLGTAGSQSATRDDLHRSLKLLGDLDGDTVMARASGG